MNRYWIALGILVIIALLTSFIYVNENFQTKAERQAAKAAEKAAEKAKKEAIKAEKQAVKKANRQANKAANTTLGTKKATKVKVPPTSIIPPGSITPDVPKAAGRPLGRRGGRSLEGSSIDTNDINPEDPIGTAAIATHAAQEARKKALAANQHAVTDQIRSKELINTANLLDNYAKELGNIAAETQKINAAYSEMNKKTEVIANDLAQKQDIVNSQADEANAYEDY